MSNMFQKKFFLLIISVFILLSSPVFADKNRFPINVDVTELLEFDGVRNNSLLEKTLIRPRFLIKNRNKKHWSHHRHGFKVKTLYLCETNNKCDSINLSLAKSERKSGQKIFPYFVGQPTKYHSIWVEYRTNKHKRKFKKLKTKSAVDFSNAYSYEMFFDSKGHKGHSVKYLASGGVAASDGVIALYQPKKGIKNLKVGSFKITIPKRATRKPFVVGFNVLEKEGDPRKRLFTEVSSIPSNKLSKSMIIKVNIGNLPANKTLDDYEFKYGSNYVKPKVLKSGIIKYISRYFENSFQVRDQDPLRQSLSEKTRSKSLLGKSRQKAILGPQRIIQHPTYKCLNELSALRSSIDNLIRDGNHNVYTSACEDLYPNIWITISELTNVSDVRITYPWYANYYLMTITKNRDGQNFPANQVIEGYDLQDINKHVAESNGATIAVNGGFWEGDEARIYTPFPVGGFNGVVHDAGQRLEGFLKYQNLIFLGFKKNNQFNEQFFNAKLFTVPRSSIDDAVDQDTFNYQGYNYVTLPSDATIVKNGQCSNYSEGSPGQPNLWSAAGITTDNRLVVISSASVNAVFGSDYITTPYDMCLVFKSLGVKDAIRLDGGSSASLSINGAHVNPLRGRNYLITGSSSRKILYTLSLY